MSWYLLPCKYKQHRAAPKPDCPNVTPERLTVTVPQWLLSDVYMDIATSKTGSSRKEFN